MCACSYSAKFNKTYFSFERGLTGARFAATLMVAWPTDCSISLMGINIFRLNLFSFLCQCCLAMANWLFSSY